MVLVSFVEVPFKVVIRHKCSFLSSDGGVHLDLDLPRPVIGIARVPTWLVISVWIEAPRSGFTKRTVLFGFARMKTVVTLACRLKPLTAAACATSDKAVVVFQLLIGTGESIAVRSEGFRLRRSPRVLLVKVRSFLYRPTRVFGRARPTAAEKAAVIVVSSTPSVAVAVSRIHGSGVYQTGYTILARLHIEILVDGSLAAFIEAVMIDGECSKCRAIL